MMSGIRFLAAALFASVVVPGPVPAPAQPPELRLDGFPVLTRTAEARRVALLGQVDLYSIAIYADGSIRDIAQLATDDRAKAVRIQVKYDSQYDPGMRPRIALDWGHELVPSMSAAAFVTLRGAFAPLRGGDVVLVAYAPRKGTTVRINQSVVVVGSADHDLMLSFLDHWLGQTVLSEDVKDTLLDQISRTAR